jgi:hypothetical protein
MKPWYIRIDSIIAVIFPALIPVPDRYQGISRHPYRFLTGYLRGVIEQRNDRIPFLRQVPVQGDEYPFPILSIPSNLN